MNSFVQNLISRHTESGHKIRPRVRGMFEVDPGFDTGARIGDKESFNTKEKFSETVDFLSDKSKTPSPVIVNPKNQGEAIRAERSSASLRGDMPVLITSNQPDEDKHDHGLEQINRSTPFMNNSQRHTKEKLPFEHQTTSGLQAKHVEKNHLIESTGSSVQYKTDSGLDAITPVKLSRLTHDIEEDPTSRESVRETFYAKQPMLTKEKPDTDRIQARLHMESLAKEKEKPVINVTIGRVEIRASFPGAEAKASPPRETKINVSLDQYLDQRASR